MSRTAFRHEALLYASQGEFMDGARAFIREGLDRDEPVLVVVDADKIAALAAAFAGVSAERVTFTDMATVGRNPARIIPAWHEFVDRHRVVAPRARMRGLGEPIWPGRNAAEVAECHQHEALLNLAFADADGFRLMCPYDIVGLAPSVIEEAHGTHPEIQAQQASTQSEDYDGVHPDELLAEPLDPPPDSAASLAFDRRVAPVRHMVADYATRFGFGARAADVALVVGELATNSVRHGGGAGTVHLWHGDAALICEVRDRGQIVDPLIGRRKPVRGQLGGRGLWVVNQMCDLVQIRSAGSGSTIRVHLRVS